MQHEIPSLHQALSQGVRAAASFARTVSLRHCALMLGLVLIVSSPGEVLPAQDPPTGTSSTTTATGTETPRDDIRPSSALRQKLLTDMTARQAEPVTIDLLSSSTLRLRDRLFDEKELQLALAQYLQALPVNDARTTRGQLAFRLDLATAHLVAERARLEQVNTDLDFRRQEELLRSRLLAEYYVRSRLLRNITISEAEIAQYYKDHPSQFAKPETVEFQIILTNTEQEARDALAELASGGTFTAVAENRSIHVSRLKGGKLTPIPRGTLEEAVEIVAFAMDDGERSGIVPGNQGFYIIERLSTREATVIPLDKARPDIYKQLFEARRGEILDRFYAKLLEGADVDLLAIPPKTSSVVGVPPVPATGDAPTTATAPRQ